MVIYRIWKKSYGQREKPVAVFYSLTLAYEYIRTYSLQPYAPLLYCTAAVRPRT